MMDARDRVKRVRQDKELTQQEFSKLLSIKMDTIKGMEVKRQKLSADTLKKVVDYFHVNANWLLNGIGPMYTTTAHDVNEPNANYSYQHCYGLIDMAWLFNFKYYFNRAPFSMIEIDKWKQDHEIVLPFYIQIVNLPGIEGYQQMMTWMGGTPPRMIKHWPVVNQDVWQDFADYGEAMMGVDFELVITVTDDEKRRLSAGECLSFDLCQ